MLQIIECPRDAMQGIKQFIPTELKVEYVNSLLKVGFHSIDFGSFVSPKAIPQMADTAEVLKNLDLDGSRSKLLAIVLNERGARDAANFDEIEYLGYPFSVSETFQLRNGNSTILESMDRLKRIRELAEGKNKKLVVYLSMAFGNPYGDPWSPEIVAGWAEKVIELDIDILSLADTVGMATPDEIRVLCGEMILEFPRITIGAHLHASPSNRKEKLEAAWDAGCRRLDGALKGFGGCPMAKDELVGNMPTELIIDLAEEKGTDTGIDKNALNFSMQLANEIFNRYQ